MNPAPQDDWWARGGGIEERPDVWVPSGFFGSTGSVLSQPVVAVAG